MEIKPRGNKIIVRIVAEAELSKSGLYIPQTSQSKVQRGTVISKGPGKYTDSGILLPIDLEPNDKVMFFKFSGQELEIDGEKFHILDSEEVWASYD